MNLKYSILSLSSCLLWSSSLQAEDQNEKKHLTIVVGTHHYSPQRTMPELKKELERLGFEVALVNPAWDPEKDKRGLPGLEVLEDTDLAIFFTRFLKLEGEQYDKFMGYIESGKPIIGLRTSGHCFNYPADNPKSKLNIDFGRDVFGSPYLIHLAGSTELKVVEDAQSHPILTGISGSWKSPGTLYLTKLEDGATPLVLGTGSPKGGKAQTRTNTFGTHKLEPKMTDNVAWTWTNKHGAKTFFTSLGHTGDFTQPNSMRLIVNGIHWAAGVPVPSAETEINTLSAATAKNIGGKKKKSK